MWNAGRGNYTGLPLRILTLTTKIVKVRRQIKRLGGSYVFALPKNDRERIVPLSDWAVRAVQRHIELCQPRPCTLPWEKLTGKPFTFNILFRWHTDDQHVKVPQLLRDNLEARTRSRGPDSRTLQLTGAVGALRHQPKGRGPSAPALLRQRHAGGRRVHQRAS